MNLFITGATGYVGQKLLKRLINQGHTVHILCRSIPTGPLYENSRVRIFRGDLMDRSIIETAMESCEQVYHLAAYARVWAKNPKTYFDTNVTGTVNILEAALHQGIQRMIFTSTGGIYCANKDEVITEETSRTQDFFNEYESSKFIAEEKVLEYSRKGLHTVIVQPTRIFGPGCLTESNATTALIKNYISGDWHLLPGSGKSIGNFTYIDDVVNGHLLAMKYGHSGERYILGGENVSLINLFEIIQNLTGKYYALIPLPYPFLAAYAWQEEKLAEWFGQHPRITTKWIKRLTLDLPYSSEKAIRDLGYSITPLQQGLQQTLDWLSRDYKLLLQPTF
jgi:farnesol dehydrogenase